MQREDKLLSAPDIQLISNRDQVVAFFSLLGYHTSDRTNQTPEAMGITATSLRQQIRRMERIANEEEGTLQIYLIDLESLSMANRQALARGFRNRPGNYLLVLTSDYERIDFVLIERLLPATGEGIAQKQVTVRPRVLSVMRRNPGPVALRVLRRFSYTEADADAQFDKLLSAYAVAEWSEPYFNNRALFSDYYLNERLPESSEWSEDPKPTYRGLRDLYAQVREKFSGKEESVIYRDLLLPAFSTLGFQRVQAEHSTNQTDEPDFHLYSSRGNLGPLALCLAYPWGRYLDGKDEARDRNRSNENPGQRVVSLLAKGEAAWVIVTNGKLWRLYAAKVHSKATNYYEVDLEETLAHPDPNEAFRYFWLLFRAKSFEGSSPFLNRLLEESEAFAKGLRERLKDRIFEEIFPHFAEGFVLSMSGVHALQALPEEERKARLTETFQGTLSFLYRLLFLFYAEALGLLPVRETREYWEISLTRLKEEVKEAAGSIGDETPRKIKQAYREESFSLYDRLSHLFKVIDMGDEAVNVPIYNGGLFMTDPDPTDHSPDAMNARFLNSYKIPDRHLALGLDLMARDIDEKRGDLVFIDYKSLGVRQLGSIYEGLLEFKLMIAEQKLAVVKEKEREVYLPFKDLEERAAERAEKQGRVIRKGSLYLANDKSERKATGSYYTPDHIVKYIVEKTLGPVLEEKCEALRPKFREAQKTLQKMRERYRAAGGDSPQNKAYLAHRDLVDELFHLRALDPAMGSGHFLVEAVDFITDKLLDFLNAFPWNPVQAEMNKTREAILEEMERQKIAIDGARLTDVNLLKRHVLKRCIFGVDLNPMAVELAKVSLWLDCFTLGAPLSFLDHHLKCGNSLIGLTVDDARAALEDINTMSLFSRSQFAGIMMATDLMRHVGELSDVTAEQVKESRAEYRRASNQLATYKRILDVYTSRWFGNGPEVVGKGKNEKTIDHAVEFLRSDEVAAWLKEPESHPLSPQWRNIAETALRAAAEKRFFHWELEFPEVFFGPREATERTVERLEGAGFDVVIGNPPYDELSRHYSGTSDAEKSFFSGFKSYYHFKNGRINLYRLFIPRGLEQARCGGMLSYIVPMNLLADDFSRPTREFLLFKKTLISVESFPQKDDSQRRVFPEAKLSTCIFVVQNNTRLTELFVRTHPGRFIEAKSPSYRTTPQELSEIFKNHIAIPTISDGEWTVLKRAFAKGDWPRLNDLAYIYVGEIFDNAPNKKFLSNKQVGPLVLRGANVDRYLLRGQPTQGENRYLNEKLFRNMKQRAEKLNFLNQERIGLQRGAAVDNWRRLIACLIPTNYYSFDTILLLSPKSIDKLILLGLLNSDLWEWRFRCTSTTNHINEYELIDLVVPPCLLDQNSEEYRTLWDLVKKVLSGALVRRSEHQEIATGSVDFEIDELIFRLYGLNESEIVLVKKSLQRKPL